jgi:hypothetical protein
MVRIAQIVALAASTLAVLLVELGAPSAEAALVGYWSFDGSNANDLSSNANNGVVGSTITFSSTTPFGSGKSISSTGSGTSVITVNTSPSLESISDTLTVSFWMQGTTANAAWVRLLGHANEGGGTQGWMVNRYSTDNDVNIRVDTLPSGFNQNKANGIGLGVLDGAWHQVAYVLDRGQWVEYVDGNISGSGTYTHGNGFSNTQALYIAGAGGSGQFAGLMDDVAVWNTRLSDKQVKAIARGTLTPLQAARRIDTATYTYTGSIQPYSSATRNDPSLTKLTDAVVGTSPTGWDDGTWVAFHDPAGFHHDNGDPQPQIDFDLGVSNFLESVRIDYLVYHDAGIYEPDRVVVDIYRDAAHTQLVRSITGTGFATGDGLQSLAVSLQGEFGRYVQMRLYNDDEWTWLGEITFVSTVPEPGSVLLLGLGGLGLAGYTWRRRKAGTVKRPPQARSSESSDRRTASCQRQ